MLDKKEASEKISENLKQIELLLRESELIAQESGVSFRWEGPTYGMGGSFTPKPEPKQKYSWDSWEASDDEDNYGWNSSSQNC